MQSAAVILGNTGYPREAGHPYGYFPIFRVLATTWKSGKKVGIRRWEVLGGG